FTVAMVNVTGPPAAFGAEAALPPPAGWAGQAASTKASTTKRPIRPNTRCLYSCIDFLLDLSIRWLRHSLRVDANAFNLQSLIPEIRDWRFLRLSVRQPPNLPPTN